MFLRRGRRGQVTVEVAVIYGMVIAGLIALALYLRRGIQGGMKGNADSFGTQFSSNDQWQSHSRSAGVETGTKVGSSQYTNTCQGIDGAPLDAANPAACDPGTLAASAPFQALCDEGIAEAC